MRDATTIRDAVRKRYDDAMRQRDENYERYVTGKITNVEWLQVESELFGMRQAYATVLGMFGECP